MVDISHTTYSQPDHPVYLQGKVRLYVRHNCASEPGTRNLYRYIEDLAGMVKANGRGVYGDGHNLILTIDVKTCNSPDYKSIAESLDALFDHHSGILSRASIGDAESFDEQDITVCLTGADVAKDAYYNLVNGSGRALNAFKDKVAGGGNTYQDKVEE